MTSSFLSKRWAAVVTTAVVVLVIAVLMLAAGCGGASLVGKWASTTGDITEFTSDGKVLFEDEELAGVDITYKVEGDRLTVTGLGTDFMKAKFAIEGDSLKLTNLENPSEVETMRRVK